VKNQPFTILDDLGSVHQYRQPDAAAAASEKIRKTIEDFRGELAKFQTDNDRFAYALEVLEKLVGTMRERASVCELQHPDLACENLDLYHVVSGWIYAVRNHF
jgi:hypothetical protein